MVPDWLWVVLTLLAIVIQTARNAVHRQLLDDLSLATAMALRFVVSLPIALLFLWALLTQIDTPLPAVPAAFWAWVVFAGVTQIFGSLLMLSAMRNRGFLVSIALTKTEPLQVALISIPMLGQAVSWSVALACCLALTGVVLLTFARQGFEIDRAMTRPAIIGISVGGLFALASIAMREAILTVPNASPFLASSVTLAGILLVQGVPMLLWLLIWRRDELPGVLPHWRRVLFVGVIGTIGSLVWFTAYALQSVTLVATVALLEVLAARVASVRMFAERLTRSEALGIMLLVAGVLLVINR